MSKQTTNKKQHVNQQSGEKQDNNQQTITWTTESNQQKNTEIKHIK